MFYFLLCIEQSVVAGARSLFRVFGGERIQGMMKLLQIEDMPIESNMLSNALDEAQRKVESYFFGARAAAQWLHSQCASSPVTLENKAFSHGRVCNTPSCAHCCAAAVRSLRPVLRRSAQLLRAYCAFQFLVHAAMYNSHVQYAWDSRLPSSAVCLTCCIWKIQSSLLRTCTHLQVHIRSLAILAHECAVVPRADIRRQLWEYDQVLNSQRDKVYAERRRALLARDLSPLMLEYAQRTVDDILEARCILVGLG